LDGALSNLV